MMDKILIPTAVAKPTPQSGSPAVLGAKKAKGQEAGDFDLAQLAAMLAAQQSEAPKPELAKAQNPQNLAALVEMARAEDAQRSGLQSMKEKSPLTQVPAASMKTAAAIAGLKPWSKNWVFEGVEQNENLKGLIPTAPQEGLEVVSDKPTENAVGAMKSPLAPKISPEVIQEILSKSRGEAATRQGVSQSEVEEFKATAAKLGPELALANLIRKREEPSSSDQLFAGVAPAKTEAFGQLPVDSRVAQVNSPVMYALPERVMGEMHTALEGPMVKVERQAAGPSAGNSALSGGEFLSTLGVVRGGIQNAGQSNTESGGNSDGQFGSEMKKNLRVIEGGAGKGKQVGPTGSHVELSGLDPQLKAQAISVPTVEVTGHVTKGAMSQDRLSSEALTGISAGIRNLSPQGGGEMRIRLKPENLGELHVRVVTNGNGNVGLQIQASDEKAKKILEESMGSLKESLASHQLSLMSVDLSVTSARNGSGLSDFNSNQNSSSGFQQDLMSSNRGNENGRSWNESSNRGSSSRETYGGSDARPALATAARTSNGNYSSSGRLDVMA